MKRMFQVNAKADTKEAEIVLYDVIGQSYWGDGVSSKNFKSQLDAIKDVDRIVLRVNSPGGDVFEGAAIYTLISQSKIPVDVIVDGLAASAAFTICMAARNISIGEAAMMMAHNAWSFAMGDHNDMRAMADTLEKVSGTFADIYAKRSGKSMKEVNALMDAETWYSAKDAVDAGFADEIISSSDKSKSAEALTSVAAAFDLSRFRNAPAALKVLKNAKNRDEKHEDSTNSGENERISQQVPVSVLRRQLDLACRE